METIKISSKGQVVIPQKIREQLKIKEGSIIAVDVVKDAIVMKSIDDDLLRQFKEGLEDLKAGRITRVA